MLKIGLRKYTTEGRGKMVSSIASAVFNSGFMKPGPAISSELFSGRDPYPSLMKPVEKALSELPENELTAQKSSILQLSSGSMNLEKSDFLRILPHYNSRIYDVKDEEFNFKLYHSRHKDKLFHTGRYCLKFNSPELAAVYWLETWLQSLNGMDMRLKFINQKQFHEQTDIPVLEGVDRSTCALLIGVSRLFDRRMIMNDLYQCNFIDNEEKALQIVDS